jgi:hypothetical protein
MNYLLLATFILLFNGCAEHSDVYPSGSNTYSISNQASTGFSGLQDIRTEAYKEADHYCKNLKKTFEVIEELTTEPPYILGNYPRITLKFECN